MWHRQYCGYDISGTPHRYSFIFESCETESLYVHATRETKQNSAKRLDKVAGMN